MKNGICFFAALLMLSHSVSAQTGAKSYTLSVAMVKQEYRSDEPIRVGVTLTNTSLQALSIVTDISQRADKDFRFRVRHSGTEPRTTDRLRGLRGEAGGDQSQLVVSTFNLSVPAGGKHIETADLRDLFKFSEPGNYTVQATRKDKESESEVRSNVLAFSISK